MPNCHCCLLSRVSCVLINSEGIFLGLYIYVYFPHSDWCCVILDEARPVRINAVTPMCTAVKEELWNVSPESVFGWFSIVFRWGWLLWTHETSFALAIFMGYSSFWFLLMVYDQHFTQSTGNRGKSKVVTGCNSGVQVHGYIEEWQPL